MSNKRQRGTEGRGAPWILAVKLLTTLVHLLSKLLRKLPYEQIAALGEKENEGKLDRMIEAIALINSGKTLVSADSIKPVSSSSVATKPRLKLVDGSSIITPAFEKFEAETMFVEDTSKDAEIQIYYLGPNFKQNFGKKIETDVERAELRAHTLLEASLDKEIKKEFGGQYPVISLATFRAALKQQGRGQKGFLLVNGYANIAYIEDDNGTVWAVRAVWNSGDGWNVEAYSVDNPNRWDVGSQVVSR